jgi:hypothetical protein
VLKAENFPLEKASLVLSVHATWLTKDSEFVKMSLEEHQYHLLLLLEFPLVLT